MNTSKQINTIIGLLMVGAIATLLYYLWDGDRQSAATERQLTENAERGGNLFSLNCRACHGLNGLGSLESTALPGLPLNTDANREADAARQDYIRGTINCGRVGTKMPPWSTKYGGPLNDFQIDQLMALITGTMTGFDQDPQASLDGWQNAVEQADHADQFTPPKHLEQAISADAKILILNNARGLRAGNLLRIDDDPEAQDYEVVQIVDAPAGSILFESVGADDKEISLVQPSVFEKGDIILIGDEQMEVVSAPPGSTLAADMAEDATVLELVDGEGFEQGQTILVRQEKMKVQSVSGNSLTVARAQDGTTAGAYVTGTTVVEDNTIVEVERGVEGTSASSHTVKGAVFEVGNEVVVERAAFGTEAAEHEIGAEVFNGPSVPSDAITGKDVDYPPCGQLPAQDTTPAAEVTVAGSAEVALGDNFFDAGGNKNPTFKVAAGSTVTFNLANDGKAVHNMVIAGPDKELGTDDDIVSDPDIIPAGETGTVQFTADAAAEYDYHCQFHPDQMKGTITVE